MRDDVNREGMTFEEWVCAAGVAVIDRFVKPYSESSYYYTMAPNPVPGTVLLVFGTSRPPPGIKHRQTVRWYSKKIRDAWKNGEDPSEWRKYMEDKRYLDAQVAERQTRRT